MYKQREIVLVPFPYSDLSSSKRGPVLIISNNNYNRIYPDILVLLLPAIYIGTIILVSCLMMIWNWGYFLNPQ